VFILLMSSSYYSLFLCFLNFSAHTTATCNAYQSAGGGINRGSCIVEMFENVTTIRNSKKDRAQNSVRVHGKRV